MNGGGGRQPIRARRRRGPESCRAFDRPSVSFRFVPFGGGVASGHRNGRSIAKRPMTSRPCGLPLSHIDTHRHTHGRTHRHGANSSLRGVLRDCVFFFSLWKRIAAAALTDGVVTGGWRAALDGARVHYGKSMAAAREPPRPNARKQSRREPPPMWVTTTRFLGDVGFFVFGQRRVRREFKGHAERCDGRSRCEMWRCARHGKCVRPEGRHNAGGPSATRPQQQSQRQ